MTQKTIRFITPAYKDLFTIPDGDQILICNNDGTKRAVTCTYIDTHHFYADKTPFHICQFAEMMQKNGARVIPFPEKRIIWSNMNLDLDDWRFDLLEEDPDLTEDQLYNRMCERNTDYLWDERMNLDCGIPNCGTILAIADLGLWDGRKTGYKLLTSGKISECLSSDSDYAEWYVDRTGEFCGTMAHHDGTNYVVYRLVKSETTEEELDALLESIYNGDYDSAELDRLTVKLGGKIGEVYGWEFPTEQN